MVKIPGQYIDPAEFHLKRLEKILDRGFKWSFNSKEPQKQSVPESDIIHLITEIRKVLEITNSKSKFLLLNFFCDWALHSSIDRSDIPIKIFKRITNIMIYGKQNLLAWARPLENIIFVEFRKDLKKFLKEYSLPIGVSQKHKEWKQFLEGYVYLIAGCPLKLNRNKLSQQKKELKTRRGWGINAKVDMLVLQIMPPFDTRPSRGGGWCEVPSLWWYGKFDNDESFRIPCAFYSLRPHRDLDLWHGLVGIGKDAELF